MSCLGLGLAGLAVFFIFTGTKTEVQAVQSQLREIDTRIDELHLEQTKTPDKKGIKAALEKLNMEKVLLPQPWLLQMELVEKGLPSFLYDVFRSPEARREALQKIVLERANATRTDDCPPEFQRLFKIYASKEGYGSERLQTLRGFASSYAGKDDSANPAEIQDSGNTLD